MSDERDTIARLADEVVPALIARLTNSQLGELEVRENGWRVRLRRPVADSADVPLPARPSTTSRTPSHSAPHAARSAPTPAAPDRAKGIATSPAVGYFAPRAGVEPGSKLRNGDVVGHVDVLGVKQEVVSPIDGALRGFEVESGQAVEYGQAIARVEAEA
jgi:biotin carboxyl carrier protein